MRHKDADIILIYTEAKYPNCALGIIWKKDGKWYQMDDEYGAISEYGPYDTFEAIGIGPDEGDWKSAREKELEKIIGADRMYVCDM